MDKFIHIKYYFLQKYEIFYIKYKKEILLFYVNKIILWHDSSNYNEGIKR